MLSMEVEELFSYDKDQFVSHEYTIQHEATPLQYWAGGILYADEAYQEVLKESIITL